MWALCPYWAWHLSGPTRAPVCVGIRDRGPECPNDKSPDSLHQETKQESEFWVPSSCTKSMSERAREWEFFLSFSLKGSPQIPPVQEGSGSVNFFCGVSAPAIFVSSLVFLTHFWLPSSVRTKVSHPCTGAQASVSPGWGIQPHDSSRHCVNPCPTDAT